MDPHEVRVSASNNASVRTSQRGMSHANYGTHTVYVHEAKWRDVRAG